MRRITVPASTLRLLQILGAASVAVAQPVLGVVADDASSVVQREVDAPGVVLFAALVVLGPPGVLWAAVEGLARWRPAAGRAALTVVLGGLGAIAATQLAIELGAGTAASALAAVLAAVGLGWASRRPGVAATLALLGGLAPVLLVWFLLLSPVADVVRAPDVEVAPQAASTTDEHLSVVLLVLDELPTASLIGADGSIDAELLPSFARLAERSTWYRNSSTAAPFTQYAVPALVTGTQPRLRKLAIAGFYPDSLFTALAPTHALNVHEPERLCPGALVCRTAPRPAAGGVPGLLRDARDVLVERLSPSGGAPEGGGPDAPEPRAGALQPGELSALAPAHVDAFVDSLQGGPESRFDYLHLVAPHQPWTILPTGQRTNGPALARDNFFGGWADQRAADAGRIRHLRSLRWVDVQLGRVLDRLEQLDRLDSTVIVVTADHGASFDAASPMRSSAPGNLAEIYWTPLLIAVPGQPGGVIDDGPVTAYDVAPTIASLVGVPLGYDVLGASVAGGVPAGRDGDRRVLAGADSTLPGGQGFTTIDGDAAFARLLALSTERPLPGPASLHREGPNQDLLGQRLDAVPGLQVASAPEPVAIDDVERFDDLDLDAPVVPLWVEGSLAAGVGVDRAEVVLTVDGVVAATPLARRDGDRLTFGAALPLALLRDGTVEVRAWEVRGAGRERIAYG